MRRHPVPVFTRPPIGAAITLVFDALLPAGGSLTGATARNVRSIRAEVIPAGEVAAVRPVQFLDLSARF